MKILITERQFEGLLVLLEEKNQKIIDKLVNFGLSEKTAIELTRVAGKISVFLVFKLVAMFENMWDMNNMTREEKFKKVEPQFIFYRDKIQSIVDWFRVGLNGNVKPYENLSFDELYNKSVEWHDSLSIGDDKIDYVEDHEVIIDFRKNGIGFYWVDLATKNCPEEGERMGHCASSSGQLYSLREYKPLGVGKNTLNKSHLTMSLSKDGKILQLKGPKNSKPPQSLHEYIIPLLYYRGENGHYLVNGFGYEYDSEHDFKLSDLGKSEIVKLYSLRPSLFESRAGKMALISNGVIEKPKDFNSFILSIKPEQIYSYVDGTWIVSENRGVKTDAFEALLSGDIHLVFDYDNYNWTTPLEYYINAKNEKKIIEIFKTRYESSNLEFDEELSLKEMIVNYDEDDEIKNALSFSYNDAQNDDAYVHFYETLHNCLSEYGEVLNLDDSGTKIKVDLENFIEEEYIVGEDLEEVFEMLLDEDILKKPDFEIDRYWGPDVNKEVFNEFLSDRLYEIS